jgi:hypothetical protein
MKNDISRREVLIGTTAFALIGGCGGATQQPAVFFNEPISLRELDVSSHLAGFSSDGVIRDDIVNIIRRLNLPQNENELALKLAKSLQEILKSEESKLKDHVSETVALVDRISEAGNGFLIQKVVTCCTFNTKHRFQRYAKYLIEEESHRSSLAKFPGDEGTRKSSSEEGVQVIFVNGVNVAEEANVQRIANEIHKLIGNNHNSQNILFDSFHNPSSGIALDLIEVATQRGIPDTSYAEMLLRLSLLTLHSGSMLMLFDELMRIRYDLQRKAEESAKDAAEKLAEKVNESQSKKIVLVGHSQGNLVILDAMKKISGKCVKVVHVAPPLFDSERVGDYLTLSIDVVLNGFRAINNNILGPTLSSPVLDDDPSGHGMFETYLRLTSSRNRLKQLITSAIEQLDADCGDGTVLSGFFSFGFSEQEWGSLTQTATVQRVEKKAEMVSEWEEAASGSLKTTRHAIGRPIDPEAKGMFVEGESTNALTISENKLRFVVDRHRYGRFIRCGISQHSWTSFCNAELYLKGKSGTPFKYKATCRISELGDSVSAQDPFSGPNNSHRMGRGSFRAKASGSRITGFNWQLASQELEKEFSLEKSGNSGEEIVIDGVVYSHALSINVSGEYGLNYSEIMFCTVLPWDEVVCNLEFEVELTLA